MWSRVDFKAGVIRLDAGTTKSREGREFVMTPQLRAALEAQRAVPDATQRRLGVIIPDVFHRDGVPIESFYKAWKAACKAAAYLEGKVLRKVKAATEAAALATT